jgi:hypothetical protein
MAGSSTKQGMNASFSAMNNSMSAKWDAIKKQKGSDSDGRQSMTPMNTSGSKFNTSNVGTSDSIPVKASN